MTNGQNGAAEGLESFAKMWTDFASRMVSAGLAFNPEAAPPEAARAIRGATFQALSRYAEEFMRSPQFLEAMKQSMDAALVFRNMMNDFLGRAQFELQGISRGDIDALTTRLKHMEMRIMERMENLSGRLEAIEDRLAAASGGKKPAAAGEQLSQPAHEKEAGPGGARKRGAR